MYGKIAWIVVNRVFVAHATEGKMSDELYSSFVEALQSEDYAVYLATTTGASELSSTQRKSASDILSSRSIPTIVVTDSRMVRGIVTAASWLGVKIESFSWAQIDKALVSAATTMGLDEEQKGQVTEALISVCGSHGVDLSSMSGLYSKPR